MVKQPCSNFRAITANFLGVRIFRIFTVKLKRERERKRLQVDTHHFFFSQTFRWHNLMLLFHLISSSFTLYNRLKNLHVIENFCAKKKKECALYTDASTNGMGVIFSPLFYWYQCPSRGTYRKNPKISDTRKICCNHPKIWIKWL